MTVSNRPRYGPLFQRRAELLNRALQPSSYEWPTIRPEPAIKGSSAARAFPVHLTGTGVNRLMCARSNAVARRVTQDHVGPFCTMTVRTARGFSDN